jgi:hypothetical protein
MWTEIIAFLSPSSKFGLMGTWTPLKWLCKRSQMKPVQGLLWTKELRPLKTDSIDNKAAVILMHQPMNLLHKELLPTRCLPSPSLSPGFQGFWYHHQHTTLLWKTGRPFRHEERGSLHVACPAHDTLYSMYWKWLDHPPLQLDLLSSDFHVVTVSRKCWRTVDLFQANVKVAIVQWFQ